MEDTFDNMYNGLFRLVSKIELPISLPTSWNNYFSHVVAVHSSSNTHVLSTILLWFPAASADRPPWHGLPFARDAKRQGDWKSEIYVAGMGCAMIFALWATFASFINFLGLTLGVKNCQGCLIEMDRGDRVQNEPIDQEYGKMIL